MMVFLGMIEERINQILQAYGIVTSKDNLQSVMNAPLNINTSLLSQDKANKMNAPIFNEEYEDEEEIDGTKPLNLEEFRLKALEKLDSKKFQGNKNKAKPSLLSKKKNK